MPGLTTLAIDLGGSHAACAVVRGGEILATRNVPVDGSESLLVQLPAIKEALFALLRTSKTDRSACAAVVLGFCGIVSAREKRVLATSGKFDDAPGIDLAGWFEKEFALPFLLENDARLALLGEASFGAAHGADDAVMITLGSGIGGAAMIGGRLLQSRYGVAGTIGGHFPVVLNGRLCACGNIGCAETEASTSFLPEIYKEYSKGKEGVLANRKDLGFAELFEAVAVGDEPAIASLEHCLCVWSTLTVALIHAYDPEVVVFGGSVLKRAADILPRLQQYVKAHAWTPGRIVPLRPAVLGSDAALLGALALTEAHP